MPEAKRAGYRLGEGEAEGEAKVFGRWGTAGTPSDIVAEGDAGLLQYFNSLGHGQTARGTLGENLPFKRVLSPFLAIPWKHKRRQ